ncbi:50S ribosomal protein L25/general stress protein Ctc [Lysinibacillus sp. FSL M8-0216]|uniref:50S ribosomal protein L25/general stress protein Ctc n=1 Tax=Lysinibacillus TaxID=400634 RepID=UPI00088E721B|nr:MULTISPECIES: 50S ribosomal protein L25/general stress protein Ctc [Lysinibacillus]MED4672295.1 50S ribosomal protein L25/general stress protein Ctc [Lysinibacillus fusiformis]QAS58143.1 50S ribosomal protein L25/general stress protein Ctc [Lysinibacillus sphaericus]RDV26330.1 50S ribosomal protein L25/general stress protein Ctc [Lysinibacillus fusiformis]SCX69210.1 LSU ribosomal protein L25P [Lysinibacillus fusiformis]SDB57287.1 LSU ribosomal protein L25P [Lysinibacillus fusiformis]
MSTVLSVTKRETGHRSTLTQLRKGGAIPAVIYGYKLDSTPISISAKEFKKSIQKNGQNSVFSLDLEGKKVNVVVSEVQQCSLKDEVNHVDFLAINMAEELEVDVPIKLVGQSVGVSEGGILMQPNLELKVKVKPAELPDSIEVDISSLKVGESLTVAEIRNQTPVEVISEDDYLLVTIVAPVSAEQEEVTASVEEEQM